MILIALPTMSRASPMLLPYRSRDAASDATDAAQRLFGGALQSRGPCLREQSVWRGGGRVVGNVSTGWLSTKIARKPSTALPWTPISIAIAAAMRHEHRSRLNGLSMATFFAAGAAGSALGAWAFAQGGWMLASAIGLAMPVAGLLYAATE
jgi:hypothetical protein